MIALIFSFGLAGFITAVLLFAPAWPTGPPAFPRTAPAVAAARELGTCMWGPQEGGSWPGLPRIA